MESHAPNQPTSSPRTADVSRGMGSLRQAGHIRAAAVPDEETNGLVFALGTLGFDFGTEARRDTFKQLMPQQPRSVPVRIPWTDPAGKAQWRTVFVAAPTAYEVGSMVSYLADNPSEMRNLIWTLNLEGTPIYAIQPYESFAREVYGSWSHVAGPENGLENPADPGEAKQGANGNAGGDDEDEEGHLGIKYVKNVMYYYDPKVEEYVRPVGTGLLGLLFDQTRDPKNDIDYIERISLPGVLTGKTVRLFSGQEVPVVAIDGLRGLYGWQTNRIVKQALLLAETTLGGPLTDEQKEDFRDALSGLLNRIYYDFRNLGVTSPDRALNFAATSIFQTAMAFAVTVVRENRELENIEVVKSPTCRPDSDCWDVKMKFFDRESLTKPRQVVRFTLDVSDKLPVTLGDVRMWLQGI